MSLPSGWVLGLDTSNYTTSAALYCAATGEMVQQKQLLPVKPGELGLRQSDAVFHHVRQLPEVVERLWHDATERYGAILLEAVAVSDRPRETEGSYMPCFLAGCGTAQTLATIDGVKRICFTHQQGHVAAALFGAGRTEWMETPLLAFHVSGGTTDALLVRPDGRGGLHCETAAQSRDLKAGQLIDRVGGMLGLPFPAGPALEQLAERATGTYRPRATMEGADCHLSGVENQCRTRMQRGEPPEEIAAFCLASVLAALDAMTQQLLAHYGAMPLLYAGGVMSNRFLRTELEKRFDGCFAPAAFSADNAAGIAFLGSRACRAR